VRYGRLMFMGSFVCQSSQNTPWFVISGSFLLNVVSSINSPVSRWLLLSFYFVPHNSPPPPSVLQEPRFFSFSMHLSHLHLILAFALHSILTQHQYPHCILLGRLLIPHPILSVSPCSMYAISRDSIQFPPSTGRRSVGPADVGGGHYSSLPVQSDIYNRILSLVLASSTNSSSPVLNIPNIDRSRSCPHLALQWKRPIFLSINVSSQNPVQNKPPFTHVGHRFSTFVSHLFQTSNMESKPIIDTRHDNQISSRQSRRQTLQRRSSEGTGDSRFQKHHLGSETAAHSANIIDDALVLETLLTTRPSERPKVRPLKGLNLPWLVSKTKQNRHSEAIEDKSDSLQRETYLLLAKETSDGGKDTKGFQTGGVTDPACAIEGERMAQPIKSTVFSRANETQTIRYPACIDDEEIRQTARPPISLARKTSEPMTCGPCTLDDEKVSHPAVPGISLKAKEAEKIDYPFCTLAAERMPQPVKPPMTLRSETAESIACAPYTIGDERVAQPVMTSVSLKPKNYSGELEDVDLSEPALQHAYQAIEPSSSDLRNYSSAVQEIAIRKGAYPPSVLSGTSRASRSSTNRHALLKSSVTPSQPIDLGLPVQPVLTTSAMRLAHVEGDMILDSRLSISSPTIVASPANCPLHRLAPTTSVASLDSILEKFNGKRLAEDHCPQSPLTPLVVAPIDDMKNRHPLTEVQDKHVQDPTHSEQEQVPTPIPIYTKDDSEYWGFDPERKEFIKGSAKNASSQAVHGDVPRLDEKVTGAPSSNGPFTASSFVEAAKTAEKFIRPEPLPLGNRIDQTYVSEQVDQPSKRGLTLGGTSRLDSSTPQQQMAIKSAPHPDQTSLPRTRPRSRGSHSSAFDSGSLPSQHSRRASQTSTSGLVLAVDPGTTIDRVSLSQSDENADESGRSSSGRRLGRVPWKTGSHKISRQNYAGILTRTESLDKVQAPVNAQDVQIPGPSFSILRDESKEKSCGRSSIGRITSKFEEKLRSASSLASLKSRSSASKKSGSSTPLGESSRRQSIASANDKTQSQADDKASHHQTVHWFKDLLSGPEVSEKSRKTPLTTLPPRRKRDSATGLLSLRPRATSSGSLQLSDGHEVPMASSPAGQESFSKTISNLENLMDNAISSIADEAAKIEGTLYQPIVQDVATGTPEREKPQDGMRKRAQTATRSRPLFETRSSIDRPSDLASIHESAPSLSSGSSSSEDASPSPYHQALRAVTGIGDSERVSYSILDEPSLSRRLTITSSTPSSGGNGLRRSSTYNIMKPPVTIQPSGHIRINPDAFERRSLILGQQPDVSPETGGVLGNKATNTRSTYAPLDYSHQRPPMRHKDSPATAFQTLPNSQMPVIEKSQELEAKAAEDMPTVKKLPDREEVMKFIQKHHQPPIQPRTSSVSFRRARGINHDVFAIYPWMNSHSNNSMLSPSTHPSLDGPPDSPPVEIGDDGSSEVEFTSSGARKRVAGTTRAGEKQSFEMRALTQGHEPQRDISGHRLRDRPQILHLKGRSHVSLRNHHGFSLSRSHRRQPIARDWSTVRKRFVATVACISTALVGILIGIYAGEVPSIQYYIADLHHYAILGNVFFYIGLAVPTIVCWPLPLLHGRKPYILAAMTIAMPLLFPQAIAISVQRSPYVSKYRVGLILPRAFMGVALGFANMNFLSILTDLFGASLQSKNPHQELVNTHDVRRHGGGLGIWLGIWTWCFVGSIGIGFLIGACIINTQSPDWGLYISIIIIAAVLLLNVITPEVRRSAYRRSVTEVRAKDEVSRRLAKGEVKMHRVQTGPTWWGQEVHHGLMLSADMLRQPGFLIMTFYLAWIYAQIVLVIVVSCSEKGPQTLLWLILMKLLGSLMSKYYRFQSPSVGATTTSIPIGALLAVPFQKASFLSRARKNPARSDSMTFQKQVTFSSHLIRRSIFTLVLPFAGLAYTLSSSGPPTPFIIPVLFAALIGFLSSLAIAECNGIIMETFDTSDLQPGMTGRPRGASGERTSHKRTNYSSFPRVSAAFGVCQGLGFLLAAGATGVGGVATRDIGQQAATGVMAGILLCLTILLLAALIRWKEVQVIPECRSADMERWEEVRRQSTIKHADLPENNKANGEHDFGAEQAAEEPEEVWRPVIIGNPSGKTRRMNMLELGHLSRWSEIRKKNRLVDEMGPEGRHPNRVALGDAKARLADGVAKRANSLRGKAGMLGKTGSTGEDSDISETNREKAGHWRNDSVPPNPSTPTRQM
jgi:uncharacterized membrane protein